MPKRVRVRLKHPERDISIIVYVPYKEGEDPSYYQHLAFSRFSEFAGKYWKGDGEARNLVVTKIQTVNTATFTRNHWLERNILIKGFKD
jgi:hypothetical protein